MCVGTGIPAQFFTCVVRGAKQGPADIKARLREELIRWHPDKFAGRLGPHISEAAAPAVRQRVKEVAQALTALMAGGAAQGGTQR